MGCGRRPAPPGGQSPGTRVEGRAGAPAAARRRVRAAAAQSGAACLLRREPSGQAGATVRCGILVQVVVPRRSGVPGLVRCPLGQCGRDAMPATHRSWRSSGARRRERDDRKRADAGVSGDFAETRALDDDQEPGGDSRFLAKEKSWRTSWRGRSLLRRTNLSSGRHEARANLFAAPLTEAGVSAVRSSCPRGATSRCVGQECSLRHPRSSTGRLASRRAGRRPSGTPPRSGDVWTRIS
jgi:hypothetical protein